ncbi:hydrogenase maturation protease [Cellulomonas sp. P24]|uniref:hydrogenase maturation protease n=1 Tax=Cellulomonas sp. P24 TaxID=2885206 RepID=UPI00216AC25D|nr:hydrogenase maturation protease [Cellulomonas sp. P24]MCR6491832.1 hydrogenase maturation protease [Cellulomonas sp. P24]
MTGTRLVIGLGSPDRGDDAVGPVVARRVARLGLEDVAVLEHEDPTGLIDLWADADVAVVVDAVCSGGEPGELLVIETGAGAEPLADQAWARTGRGGTHAFGLAAAVELGRALGRLPARLVLVGVEASAFEHGAPLSPAVHRVLDAAVGAVVGAVAGPFETAEESEVTVDVPG